MSRAGPRCVRRRSSGDKLLTARGKGIAPKTAGQKRYVDAIRGSTVTFAIGPAGTGKTYLAVATAVRALQERQVSRLILTRPAVEAGERLGYLPGTLYEKIDPYMRPLYDALFEMTGAETLPRLMERGTVEVAPLAYMRGRTLNDAFIILDEAQNTTPEQMKMFLTRLGFGSKAVINGDSTQVDLPNGQRVGSARRRGDPRGHRGHLVLPPRRPRRRAAPDRAGHRGGVRPLHAAGAAGRDDRRAVDDRRRRPSVDPRLRPPVRARSTSTRLEALARATLLGEGSGRAELRVSFVDDDEIEDLHVRFMDEPGPTDVLSFPLDEDDVDEDDVRVLGDVVICPAVAARNNPADPEAEIRLLLVHGILHLLGYDHEEDERAGRDVGTAGALQRGAGAVTSTDWLEVGVIVAADRRGGVPRPRPRSRSPARTACARSACRRRAAAAPRARRGSWRTRRRT